MSADVRIISPKPKYPPIKDGKRVCYLLLHVHAPSNGWPVRSIRELGGIESARKAGEILGVKIWPMRLAWSNGEHSDYRYLFRFPRYRRDDQRAQRISECFLHALVLTFGPFMDNAETACVFRVPAQLTQQSRVLLGDELAQVEEARRYEDRTLEFPYSTLGSAMSTAAHHFDAAWKITPILVQNEPLYRAVLFLKASQDDFFVWPGQIDEILGNPELAASTGFEQIRLENALQSAFKTVEAVLGDPPKDDLKFFAKIRSIGLDPDEQVGYGDKLPLHEVIRHMNAARDKKAAHGGTPHRTITVGELMEYQACARLVVWAAIENVLGEPVYDTSGG